MAEMTKNFNAILMNRHPQRESKFVLYANMGQIEKYFEGETIVCSCKSDADAYLYYVVSGSVKACYQRIDGSELVLFYRQKGNFFQAEYNHFASICNDKLKFIAAENTIVSSFTKAQLYQLLREDKELFDEFLFTVHLTYASFAHRIVNTACLSSNKRMLTWLSKLCSVNEPDKKGHYKLPCDLTQQQIADLLFIHVTTCNKLFSFLEKENLVKKTKNYIEVYDWEKLKEYLEYDHTFCLDSGRE